MKVSLKKKSDFQIRVWNFYTENKRVHLPWRNKISAYKVYVSEIMLQQTQVDRVITFFNNWMKLFPTIKDLANASQHDILKAWKGLGYNSRALRMKKAAEIILEKYKGIFPKRHEDILELPGIGPYTAGAISAFAYDNSVVMIETNIRRVYLHHFFKESEEVHDREIFELINQTLPENNFREWYFALMDYGSHLGKTISNPNKKSRHYIIQKKFKGSNREIRGKILSLLLVNKKMSLEKLVDELAGLSTDQERIEIIIQRFEKDGFIEIKNGVIYLKK